MATNPISSIGDFTRQQNEQSLMERLGKGAPEIRQAERHAQPAGASRRATDEAAIERARQRRDEQTPRHPTAGRRVDTYA